MPVEPLGDKWKAFNWNVREVDGHNVQEIVEALTEARQINGMPTVIIAHTTKGKGVSFMEDQAVWHSKAPTDAEHAQAIQELLAACKGDVR